MKIVTSCNYTVFVPNGKNKQYVRRKRHHYKSRYCSTTNTGIGLSPALGCSLIANLFPGVELYYAPSSSYLFSSGFTWILN